MAGGNVSSIIASEMVREVFLFSQVDPRVLEAHDVAKKLFGAYRLCNDSLTRKVFKGMVFDALEYEAELKLKLRAKDEVEILHDLQKPKVNLN